jgi:hypothetical protein
METTMDTDPKSSRKPEANELSEKELGAVSGGVTIDSSGDEQVKKSPSPPSPVPLPYPVV